MEPRIDGCIDRPFGDEHVLPEIAERPGVPGGGLDREEVAPMRRRDRRVGETGYPGNADPVAVAKRVLPACCPPAVAERRSRDDPADSFSLALQRDQCRPHGDAAREVLRPIDRVDDPSDRAPVVTLLLTEDALARTARGDPLPQCALDRPVRVRDRRQVGLGVDVQVVRAKARQAERVGQVGKFEGEGEVGGYPPSLVRSLPWSTSTVLRSAYAGSQMRTVVLHTQLNTQLVDVTAEVREVLDGQTALIFVPHTTAGVVLHASGADASAVAATSKPPSNSSSTWSWQHTAEGDRNPWAHVRSVLTGSSVTIPLENGQLALGDLQTIFLCEFDGPRERKIYVSVT
jgi:secondary thiamine-phosphate synthase enzyme